MSNELHPRWTPQRHAWLRQLVETPGVNRTTRTGFDCMRLGWTEWARENGVEISGEQITDAGREILSQWNKEHP